MARVGREQGSDSCYDWEVEPAGFPERKDRCGERGLFRGIGVGAKGGASFSFLLV